MFSLCVKFNQQGYGKQKKMLMVDCNKKIYIVFDVVLFT